MRVWLCTLKDIYTLITPNKDSFKHNDYRRKEEKQEIDPRGTWLLEMFTFQAPGTQL